MVTRVSPGRQVIVIVVAVCAVLIGFVPLHPSELLQIGRPELSPAGFR
jgi:hypothetical protein